MKGNSDVKFRSCTDIIWLLIFCFFLVALVAVSAFAIVYGDSRQLIFGADSFGNLCGSKNAKLDSMSFTGLDMTDKPFLFFLDTTDIERSLKICVTRCPEKTLQSDHDLYDYYVTTGTNVCLYSHEFIPAQYLPGSSKKQTSELVVLHTHGPLGPCPRLPVFESSSVMNRCVPKNIPGVDSVFKIYAYMNSADFLQQFTSDVYSSWREILSLTCLSAALSLLILLCLHLVVSLVGWLLLGLTASLSIAVTGYLWTTYYKIKCSLDETPPDRLLEEEINNEEAFLLYSVFATFGTIILLLILFAMRKRMHLAGSLFKEASRCMRQVPFLFVQPCLTFLALLIFMVAWFYVVVCLATATKPERTLLRDDLTTLLAENRTTFSPSLESTSGVYPTLKEFTIIDNVTPRTVRYFWWVLLVALLWVPQFILAAQQFIISSTVGQWYFTRDKSELRRPILRSIGWLIFYHIGSVACGSFLITLCKVPQLLITWLQNKLMKFQDDSCRASSTKMCCCCFCVLERFLRYLNHNAYTVIAIEGTSFCPSAKIAFQTLASNILQIAVLNSVGDFVLFLGKFFTTAVVCFVGMGMLQQREELQLYAAPLLISCVFAYFVSHCVLSLYEMVVDTMLLCYCEDVNTSDDRASHNPFTPPSFQRVVNSGAKRGNELQVESFVGSHSADELTEMTTTNQSFKQSLSTDV